MSLSRCLMSRASAGELTISVAHDRALNRILHAPEELDLHLEGTLS
jgi:hypothetical protein